MNTMRIVALNLAFTLGLFATDRAALAQSVPARGPTPGQADFAQAGPGATAPAVPAAAAPAPPPPPMTTVPGQPYLVVDPATGRPMPMLTYGPMLRQRPAVLPYTEGASIPRGYVLEEYHPRGLIIGGAVTLGVLYAISFSVASGNNFDSANGWLAVPVIGPFGWLAARKTPTCSNAYDYSYSCNSDESGNRTMVALDGMGQAAGAAMLIAGLAITRKHLLLADPQEVIVAPYSSSTGAGLRVLGRF